MKGYILESRSILESEIWKKPPLYFKVWHYLLLNANFRDDGLLKRGQLITSVKEIQEAMSYKSGYRTEKPQTREIQRILEFLRGESRVTRGCRNGCPMIVATDVATGVAGSILVTICNFNKYQDFKTYGCRDECRDGVTTDVATDGQRTDSFLFIQNKENTLIHENTQINNDQLVNARGDEGPPTVDEVREYCEENGLVVDADVYVDFYASKGWKVGSEPMHDWKASVRNWARRHAVEDKKSSGPVGNTWSFMDMDF